MTYSIEVSRLALKNMASLSRKDLLRLDARINDLAVNPMPTDVKKLRGDDNLYRIRSGNYRILYRIFHDRLCILIVDVDHRKDVYKGW